MISHPLLLDIAEAQLNARLVVYLDEMKTAGAVSVGLETAAAVADVDGFVAAFVALAAVGIVFETAVAAGSVVDEDGVHAVVDVAFVRFADDAQ